MSATPEATAPVVNRRKTINLDLHESAALQRRLQISLYIYLSASAWHPTKLQRFTFANALAKDCRLEQLRNSWALWIGGVAMFEVTPREAQLIEQTYAAHGLRIVKEAADATA